MIAGRVTAVVLGAAVVVTCHAQPVGQDKIDKLCWAADELALGQPTPVGLYHADVFICSRNAEAFLAAKEEGKVSYEFAPKDGNVQYQVVHTFGGKIIFRGKKLKWCHTMPPCGEPLNTGAAGFLLDYATLAQEFGHCARGTACLPGGSGIAGVPAPTFPTKAHPFDVWNRVEEMMGQLDSALFFNGWGLPQAPADKRSLLIHLQSVYKQACMHETKLCALQAQAAAEGQPAAYQNWITQQKDTQAAIKDLIKEVLDDTRARVGC